LQAYFTRIALPEKYLQSPILSNPTLATDTSHALPHHRALHRHHVATIPFENLELHYSAHKKISLHYLDLFTKFVSRGTTHGRGGRCMENNTFFATILRSLGYDVKNSAARVSRMQTPSPEIRELQGNTYDPWNHMLNLVQMDGKWWVVDVGMGAMGPNIVYPLEDGFESVAVAPRRIRLQKRAIAETAALNREQAPKLWCYDVCKDPGVEGGEVWTPSYCFTEVEFLPQDYEMMSWFTSTFPRSLFT
jgi:arylamine N-acetyltransferase